MSHRNTFTVIDDPEDGLLELYYSSYNQVFTRADEKESLDGFKELLAGNALSHWRKELVLVAEDGGATSGGASWAAYDLGDEVVVWVSYVHTEPFARRRGLSRSMLGELMGHTEVLFGKPCRTVLLESEPEALEAWERMGFKRIPFAYVAPVLHGDGVSIDHLTLMYLGEEPQDLYESVRLFFDYSYFRGVIDSREHPVTGDTLKRLARP